MGIVAKIYVQDGNWTTLMEQFCGVLLHKPVFC